MPYWIAFAPCREAETRVEAGPDFPAPLGRETGLFKFQKGDGGSFWELLLFLAVGVCEMRNETGHNGIFRIPPLLLKLAPFLAH
jgi:hypothetical protein